MGAHKVCFQNIVYLYKIFLSILPGHPKIFKESKCLDPYFPRHSQQNS